MEIIVNFKGGGTITVRDKNLIESFDQDIQNYSLNGKPRFIQLEKGHSLPQIQLTTFTLWRMQNE